MLTKVNSCLQQYEEFDNRVIRGIQIALDNAANLMFYEAINNQGKLHDG